MFELDLAAPSAVHSLAKIPCLIQFLFLDFDSLQSQRDKLEVLRLALKLKYKFRSIMVVDKVQVHLNQVQVHLGHLLVSKEVAQVLEGELKFQLTQLLRLELQVSVTSVVDLGQSYIYPSTKKNL